MAEILLCEDDGPLREVYHMVLTTAGHSVDIAENGKEGIKKCRRNRYDLILLDLMMPEVDGVEFMRRTKIRQKSPSTCVVVLSNLSSGEEVEAALALGAHRHVLKSSLTPRDLIELTSEMLGTPQRKKLANKTA